MTLEEKIRDKALEEKGIFFDSAQQNIRFLAFKDGAHWMLDELLPVMKEMKEAIEGAIRIKDLWIMNDINTPPEHHGEAFAVDSMLYEFKQVLEKHNALFEDKQKQS